MCITYYYNLNVVVISRLQKQKYTTKLFLGRTTNTPKMAKQFLFVFCLWVVSKQQNIHIIIVKTSTTNYSNLNNYLSFTQALVGIFEVKN